MNEKIVNINNEKIRACFQFEVGNCLISVSTIFNKDRPEIAIFDKNTNECIKTNLPNVQNAISWAFTFGDRD